MLTVGDTLPGDVFSVGGKKMTRVDPFLIQEESGQIIDVSLIRTVQVDSEEVADEVVDLAIQFIQLEAQSNAILNTLPQRYRGRVAKVAAGITEQRAKTLDRARVRPMLWRGK